MTTYNQRYHSWMDLFGPLQGQELLDELDAKFTMDDMETILEILCKRYELNPIVNEEGDKDYSTPVINAIRFNVLEVKDELSLSTELAEWAAHTLASEDE